jgi:anti-sigma regulatory factor (Ser/Thr protein kinase)
MMAQDWFQIEANAKWDQLTITFTDSGRPFDPTAVKTSVDYATASHNRQKRGYGLPMIHQLANGVAYHRDDTGHNVLTITKKWQR